MTVQEVHNHLKNVIKDLHEKGWFVSGCISIDIAAKCPDCGYQMQLIQEGDYIKRICPKCKSRDINYGIIKQQFQHMDTEICRLCGNSAIRSGSCYTCTVCGATSSCS